MHYAVASLLCLWQKYHDEEYIKLHNHPYNKHHDGVPKRYTSVELIVIACLDTSVLWTTHVVVSVAILYSELMHNWLFDFADLNHKIVVCGSKVLKEVDMNGDNTPQ
jgi:hypothetical protein